MFESGEFSVAAMETQSDQMLNTARLLTYSGVSFIPRFRLGHVQVSPTCVFSRFFHTFLSYKSQAAAFETSLTSQAHNKPSYNDTGANLMPRAGVAIKRGSWASETGVEGFLIFFFFT